MRCYKCKASCETHYAESYEVDWYCLAGVTEDEMNEDKSGEWGCNLHYKTIEKRVEENDKAWLKDKEEFVKWFEEQERINALKENENDK